MPFRPLPAVLEFPHSTPGLGQLLAARNRLRLRDWQAVFYANTPPDRATRQQLRARLRQQRKHKGR